MRRWFRRRSPAAHDPIRTFNDELRFHLDARSADLEAAGVSPTEARATAQRELGDVADARLFVASLDRRSAARRERRHLMTSAWQDVRYALRRLRRSPAFTTTVVLTFALGIGANAAIFSIVNGVLLQPLAFPRPDQLYAVYSANRTAGLAHASVSAVDLDDWRAGRQRIEDIGGYFYSDGSSGLDLTGRGEPKRLAAVFITPGFLSALGVRPLAGRLPREEEMVRGGPDRIAVLTDGFWAREFGRDPAVVGGTLTLDGAPYSVIGVLPGDLQFPTERADVFVPFSTIPDSGIPRIRPVRLLDVVARARPGVSRTEVATEMSAITARLATLYPDDQAWGNATVEPLAETFTGSARDGLLVLWGAVGLVLALACVNVASLQLARTASRARDLAISAALGAGRSRLIRQMLTEGLVLSVGGGLIGVAVATGAVSGLLHLASGQLPRATGVRVDGTVLAFALVVSIVAGLVASLMPALRATRRRGVPLLREAGRGLAGSESPRLRAALVIVEVAVAVMLAIGAGLMARSFTALRHVDPGFRSDHMIAAQFTINSSRHEAFTSFYTAVIDRVRALPGVVSAAAVKDAPFRGSGERIGFTIPAQPVAAGQDSPTTRAIHVSDGYFAAIGARLIAGREFTRRDRAGSPLVLIVNEAFARHFFPSQPVVGQRLLVGKSESIEIVGLVHDIHQVNLADPVPPTVYLDNLQNSRVKTTIVARTEGDPVFLAAALREAIWSMDSSQAIEDVFTFDAAMSRSLAAPRLLTVLLMAFGTLGFALGVIGVYGLLASLVNRRRREIGVRMALGASAAVVAADVVKQGAWLAGAGVVLGVLGAFGLTRFLSAVLFGVAPLDPATFVATVGGLMGAALVASWLPARRASRVDPAHALRSM